MSTDNKTHSKVVFRIFTQDIPRYHCAVIKALQSHGFRYYTIVSGVGYGPDQKGKPENSLVLDVAVKNYSPEIERKMVAAVEQICEDNGPKRADFGAARAHPCVGQAGQAQARSGVLPAKAPFFLGAAW